MNKDIFNKTINSCNEAISACYNLTQSCGSNDNVQCAQQYEAVDTKSTASIAIFNDLINECNQILNKDHSELVYDIIVKANMALDVANNLIKNLRRNSDEVILRCNQFIEICDECLELCSDYLENNK